MKDLFNKVPYQGVMLMSDNQNCCICQVNSIGDTLLQTIYNFILKFEVDLTFIYLLYLLEFSHRFGFQNTQFRLMKPPAIFK